MNDVPATSLRTRRWLQAGCAVLALALPVLATAGITSAEQAGALRDALSQGAKLATDKLGKTDGFFGNPEVKIPLPKTLRKAKGAIKMLGLGPQADALVLSMNRAAEAAMPEAKAVLLDSVKQMTIDDAVGILKGPDDAATQYFKRTSTPQLRERLLPIVQKTTGKVGVAQKYNALAGKLAGTGVLKPENSSVEAYVTDKALDGLFLMVAKEEAAIRKNPLGQASSLIKKVFGTLIK